MAIRVNVGAGFNGDKQIITEENVTIKQVLEDNNINYNVGTTWLGGLPLEPQDLDRTFAEMGVTESVSLRNVVKAAGGR